MDTTGTLIFESRPQPLSFEDSAEVYRLKKEFDHSSVDSLKRTIRYFTDTTKHHMLQYDAIITSSSEDGDFSRAVSLNECLLRDLKLRSVAAFEAAADACIVSRELSDELIRVGTYIASERELRKKNRASLSRNLSHSLKWQAAG